MTHRPMDDRRHIFNCEKCGVGDYNMNLVSHCCGCKKLYQVGVILHCCACHVVYDEWDDSIIKDWVQKEQTLFEEKKRQQDKLNRQFQTQQKNKPIKQQFVDMSISNPAKKGENDIRNCYIMSDDRSYYDIVCYKCGGPTNECVGFDETYMERFRDEWE